MLNLKQKAVLCCLGTTKRFNGSVTIRKLFDFYTTLCKKERLPVLHLLLSTEFRDVVVGVVNMMARGVGIPSKSRTASSSIEDRYLL